MQGFILNFFCRGGGGEAQASVSSIISNAFVLLKCVHFSSNLLMKYHSERVMLYSIIS